MACNDSSIKDVSNLFSIPNIGSILSSIQNLNVQTTILTPTSPSPPNYRRLLWMAPKLHMQQQLQPPRFIGNDCYLWVIVANCRIVQWSSGNLHVRLFGVVPRDRIYYVPILNIPKIVQKILYYSPKFHIPNTYSKH